MFTRLPFTTKKTKAKSKLFLLCIYGDYKSIMCVSIYYYNRQTGNAEEFSSAREGDAEASKEKAAKKPAEICH